MRDEGGMLSLSAILLFLLDEQSGRRLRGLSCRTRAKGSIDLLV
jgi:hypothetical protein